MALSDGDDFVSGSILSFQQANRLKNHWRGAAAPTGAQHGMLYSGSSNNKLFHCIDDSLMDWDEVLQETMSFDKTPIFDNLVLDVDTGSLSDPPTNAELSAIFGSSPANGFLGFVQSTESGQAVYFIFAAGGDFYYLEMTKAV